MKINSISPQKHKYLQIINTIAKSPERLYFIGNLPEDRITSVAIVGTRRPSSYGQEVTYKLSYELARRGIVIVSGLALGVDSIAHKAALEAGGKTIAVLANGLDTIYPATNKQLALKIAENEGAIISEYEPNAPPLQYRFLERNRIVSGLADAILVTEAAARSGTQSTIAHALEQGREVFVVPGNITSPLSSGCNAWLKQGAHPATCVEDILEVIAPDLLRPQTALPLGDNPNETNIISLLSSGLRNGDEIQKESGLSATDFSQTLTMLEINGIIRPLGGNQWTLK